MFSMNPESAITLVIVENKPLLLTAFSATLATEGVKTLSISSNLSCKKRYEARQFRRCHQSNLISYRRRK
jgi:hypothetical protein